MTRSESARLDDIAAAIARCLAYREHLDSDELGAMAYDAVLRNLAVIGEAVKGLPEDFKAENADVPWSSFAGLRNVVVHEHFRVDPDLVRDIVDDQLSTLLAVVTHS
ncbi:DUF86 domain-containing protein [Aquipuribacter nitratireducens]|uniref:DUF86 domain-containing protein n=1 Tax=Aquipuribacter nitratireducens TaxID=650104 RepID=A0ABW0GMD5_9MICO